MFFGEPWTDVFCRIITKEILVTFISSLRSMILALINDWSWRGCGWSQQCTVEEPETAHIILRTVTIAVYIFVFEQKLFLLYFYHIKYLKSMNWVFVNFWFSTSAWTVTERWLSLFVCWRWLNVCYQDCSPSLACQRNKGHTPQGKLTGEQSWLSRPLKRGRTKQHR